MPATGLSTQVQKEEDRDSSEVQYLSHYAAYFSNIRELDKNI